MKNFTTKPMCHPERIQEDARRTSTSAEATNLSGTYGEDFAIAVGFLPEVFESLFAEGFPTVRYLRKPTFCGLCSQWKFHQLQRGCA